MRDAIAEVALDPFAGYNAAVRDGARGARITIDKFHAVRLANQVVTDVRCRRQQELTGHRGRKGDPLWGVRRDLLRGREHLWQRAWERIAAAPTAPPVGSPTRCTGCARAHPARLLFANRAEARRAWSTAAAPALHLADQEAAMDCLDSVGYARLVTGWSRTARNTPALGTILAAPTRAKSVLSALLWSSAAPPITGRRGVRILPAELPPAPAGGHGPIV
ncbi:MAG: transposase [Actinomycetota bacterium]|nr:transposase [Actinomycetota bacterium]